MAQKESDRFYIIDTTTKEPNEVEREALEVILDRLTSSEYVLEKLGFK